MGGRASEQSPLMREPVVRGRIKDLCHIIDFWKLQGTDIFTVCVLNYRNVSLSPNTFYSNITFEGKRSFSLQKIKLKE